MSRSVLALLLAMTLFAPVFQSAVHAAPARATMSADLMQVVTLVNAQRATAGLAPFTVHPVLVAEAQRFSSVQAALGTLSHRGNDGSTPGQRLRRAGYTWRALGENLAAGQQTADEVVTAWMHSPSHRAVILNPKTREIGIGRTILMDDPAGYYSYWVLETGRRR